MVAAPVKAARVVRRALALSGRERRQALAAAALLAYVNGALKLLPFAKMISWGSVPTGPETRDKNEIVDDVVRAVKRASYAAPWRTVCIHEGLAAQRMLRRAGVPAVLCYGTRQGDTRLQSHVWVMVGDRIVVGGEEAPNHSLLAAYPPGESATIRPFSSLST